MIRVRIAPSPTGPMHIGTARTALFNWLFAQKKEGVFILRIEDTDRERSEKKFEQSILDGLSWLQIEPDETYRQSERGDIYKKYIKKILDSGEAFYCPHTFEELEKEKKEQESRKLAPRHVCDDKKRGSGKGGGVIRFHPEGEKIKFVDLIRGDIEFDSELLGDFSIAKDENTVLYNFAAAVDDYEMKISHVIRGEDHISNTPKQILIQQALGFNQPQYAHLPLILGADKSKLSKRHGAVSLSEYKDMGYLADAMFNFLTFLGWNPNTDEEIMSYDEIIEKFSLEGVQKSGAVFSVEKLDWMNGEYIRKMPLDKLTELSMPYLPKNSGLDIKKIIALEQSRMKRLSEIGESTAFFFEDKLKYEPSLLKWKDMSDAEIAEIMEKLRKLLEEISKKDYTKEKLEKIIMPKAEEWAPRQARGKGDRGYTLWLLRVALTGCKASPGPFEIMEILGKEKSLTRLREAMKP